MSIKGEIYKEILNFRWRMRNAHNETKIRLITKLDLIEVGRFTYGYLAVVNAGRNHKLYIGDYCSIAYDVTFIVQGEHNMDRVSTFPYRVKILSEKTYEAESKGDIIIGDDVWIGQGATILSGVRVGQGAVIAAGAMVTEDVPPYAIVAGMPAKIKKYRFSKEVREYLNTLDYKSLSKKLLECHISDMYIPINNMTLKDLEKIYEWFPKKRIRSVEVDE